MPAPARRSVRPYLRAPERRRHLLDAAAGLVREAGWTSLTMQGVADAAGVTRQLVYGHFESLEVLQRALLVHLFEPAYEATRATLHAGLGTEALLRRAYEVFLDLPAEQRFVIRSLAGAAPGARDDLAPARRILRTRIAGLWVPLVSHETGLPANEAQALAWMLLGSAWALADLVADGSLDRLEAIALFARHGVRTLATARRTPAPRERTAPPRVAPSRRRIRKEDRS